MEIQRDADVHGVAEGEKAVAFLDSLAVGAEGRLPAEEGADQHHQGGTRQVEVGNQGIHHFEGVARGDKDLGPARLGQQFALRRSGGFQGAHAGGGRWR